MKALPWRKRAEQAHAEVEQAKRLHDAITARRSEVYSLAGMLIYHGETNGWTETIGKIFSGGRRESH